jgi:hypothetical protein
MYWLQSLKKVSRTIKQLFILIFWPNFTSLWKNVGWAKNIGRAKKLRKPEN